MKNFFLCGTIEEKAGEYRVNIGEKIEYYRKQAELSQKKLAELSGISEVSIFKYENGQRNPKPEQLKKIAKALNISESLLIEIPWNSLEIETVGQFMSMIYSVMDKTDVTFLGIPNEQGEFSGDYAVAFKHPLINECFSRLSMDRQLTDIRVEAVMENAKTEGIDEAALQKIYMDDIKRNEVTRHTLTNLNDSMKEECE